jgi:ankyrin repeat protein
MLSRFDFNNGQYYNGITDTDMPNYFEGRRMPSLHQAVQFKRLDVVRYCIANDADVNSRNNLSETPLRLAAKNGYLYIV